MYIKSVSFWQHQGPVTVLFYFDQCQTCSSFVAFAPFRFRWGFFCCNLKQSTSEPSGLYRFSCYDNMSEAWWSCATAINSLSEAVTQGSQPMPHMGGFSFLSASSVPPRFSYTTTIESVCVCVCTMFSRFPCITRFCCHLNVDSNVLPICF